MKAYSQLYRAVCYRYGVATAAVVAAIAARLTLLQGLGPRAAFVTCYPAVVLASLYGGLGPGLLATALSALAADYLWMAPIGGLALRERADMLALSIFAGTCAAIAWVVEIMHRAETRARDSQAEAAAQEALRQGEERLRFALETSGTGVWDLDLVDHTTVRSLEHDRIFGYTELLPQWTYEMFLDHVLPEDRAAVDAKFRHATATQSDWSFECRIRRVDGEVRWIWAAGRHRLDPAGTARRMAGIVQDVTARKEADQQLQAEKDFSIQIIQSAPVVICGVAPDGTITFINPAGEAITGYRAADLIGKNWWQIFYPGEQYRQVKQVFRDFDSGQIRDYEMTLTTRDGSQRTIAWNSLLTRDSAGNIVHSLGFGVDVTERKRAAAAVQASRQMLQTVVNHLPAAVALVRGSDLRLQLINPAYQAIAPGKEMIGKTLDELWPETGQTFAAICRRVLETGEPHQAVDELNTIRRRPDGPLEPAYFSWSLHRVHLPGDEGWGLLNTAWETTERKQATMRLAADLDAMTRLREVGTLYVRGDDLDAVLGEIVDAAIAISHADLGSVQILDAASSELRIVAQRGFPQWWIDFWNTVSGGQGACGTALERGGRVIVEDVEQSPVFAGTPALAIQLRAGVRAVQSTPITSRSGKLLGMFSTHYKMPQCPDERAQRLLDLLARQAADIIERAQAEAELRERENQLRLFVEHAPAALAMFDREMRYLGASRRWRSDYGLEGRDLHGQSHYDVFPEIPERWREIHRRGLGGEVVRAEEDSFQRLDGSVQWLRWEVRPWHDAAGQIPGILIFSEDITERVGLQSELRRRNEELAEEARSRDEFLAMLGHELRNPLAAVTTAVAVARRDPQRRDRALEIAEEQAGEMASMVDDLLDVARITQGKITLRMQPLSLATVIERALESARPLIDERRHELHVALPEPGVTVEGDTARLLQVFVNLLGNAVKFTPAGGRIEVVCESAGAQTLVHVRDNGVGIGAELLPRVFDLFAQGEQGPERAGGGLGIGLAVVRRLVELHGGSVEARSEGIGRGARFTVCLPLAAAATAEIAGPPSAASSVGGSTSVLVVEDNAAVAGAVSMLLEGLVEDVRVAADGPAALEAVRTRPPALALIDIGLPGMNGYELARAIRALPESPGMVLVALTGYGRDEDKSASRVAGFDHHLTKPLDLKRLNEIVQQARVAQREAEGRCAGPDR